MQKNAFWVSQHLWHFSVVDGDLPQDLQLNWCIIYLGDIVIFLKHPTSHLMRLEIMFKKLEHARLKLKPLQCDLFHQQISYLGHMWDSHQQTEDKSH